MLTGLKIAILLTTGFQQIEMTGPRKMLQEAGAIVHLVSPNKEVEGWDCDIPKALDKFAVDVDLDSACAQDYDALIIPGGYASPEELRLNDKAIEFVKSFKNKLIAAICHGPIILVNAGLIKNKQLTSYPAIKQDLINSGANWSDKVVVIDRNLITSRSPDDLKEFNKAIFDFLVNYKSKNKK